MAEEDTEDGNESAVVGVRAEEKRGIRRRRGTEPLGARMITRRRTLPEFGPGTTSALGVEGWGLRLLWGTITAVLLRSLLPPSRQSFRSRVW